MKSSKQRKIETIYGTSPKNLFENINRILKEDKLSVSQFKNLVVKNKKGKQVFRISMLVRKSK